MEKKKKVLKNILKVILIIIAVLIIIFIIHTTRNYIIISKMQNNLSEYANSKNFYVKTVTTYENDGSIVTTEFYKKDNKEARFIERKVNNDIAKLSLYNNGEKNNIFIEEKDSKIARLNVNMTVTQGMMYNGLETEKKWHIAIGAISARIKSVKYENKECYEISGFISESAISFNKQKVTIEKDTGLLVKIEGDGVVTKREQRFNNIEDSIFVEPDINQYTLQEIN